MTGGCQCGEVRYVLNRVGPLYACHCHVCQKQSGSAFGLSMLVLEAALTVRGVTAIVHRTTPSGAAHEGVFCPACGGRLFNRNLSRGNMVTLKAGTLDDTSALSTSGHIWMSEKQSWVIIDAGTPTHLEQPRSADEWMTFLRGGAQ